jgi:hypothetical protein
MAITFSRYIDITSGVGAGAVVPRRDLIGRLFTVNPLLPPQSYITFTTAAEVGSYFGTTSEEYARAVFYFGWVSKNITRAQKISFARWVQTAVAPKVFGSTAVTQALATYTAISNGSFSMTIGGVTNAFTGTDFTAAASLSDVATVLQTKIRTASGAQWTSSTVVYNATRGTFDFTGGTTGAATISVAEGVAGTPIAALIGWIPAATTINGAFSNGAIWASGSAVETITATLTASVAASNNFGTFLFMPTLAIGQVVEAATWNVAQNVSYMYTVPVITANVSAWATALADLGGVGMTLSDTANEYPEQVPMMIEAATAYDQPNSVQNYMFQMFNLTPGVTSDANANVMDAARVNYYGRTQDAGQFIDFYQRGVLYGIATDPVDMNVYANEQWLKDAAGAAIMTLLLSLARVSANAQGRTQILTTLQSVINDALNNGTISIGKTLTTNQKLFITEITADPNAWYQVQTIGYWVDCVIESYDSPLQYKAVYTLVYSKDDAIRKVEGRHVLI